jgi:hypothetical protein
MNQGFQWISYADSALRQLIFHSGFFLRRPHAAILKAVFTESMAGISFFCAAITAFTFGLQFLTSPLQTVANLSATLFQSSHLAPRQSHTNPDSYRYAHQKVKSDEAAYSYQGPRCDRYKPVRPDHKKAHSFLEFGEFNGIFASFVVRVNRSYVRGYLIEQPLWKTAHQ